MKLTDRLSFSIMMTLLVIMGGLCSCSSPEMFELIPADADYVATVDIADFIEKSGFEISGSGISGPTDLKAELQRLPDNVRKAIIDINKAVDTHRIVLFGYATASHSNLTDCYVLAKITDDDALDELLKQPGIDAAGKSDGFTIHRCDDTFLLQRDGFLWIVEASDGSEAAAKVKKAIQSAADGNITSNSRVCNILSEHNAANAVVNLNPFIDLISKYSYRVLDTQQALIAASVLPKFKDNWMSATLSYSSTEAELIARIFNPDSGENLRLPLLKPISDNALKNIPDDAMIAGAAGIDNNELSNIIDALKPLIRRDPMATIALAQLRNISGTIGFAIPADYLIGLLTGQTNQSPDFTIFAETQNESSSEIKELINNLASASVNCRIDGNTIIISTSPIQKSGNSRLVKLMEGKDLAVAGEITSFSRLTDGCSDIGAKASVTYKDGEVRILIAFSNVKGSMIAELIKLVNALEGNDSLSHRHNTISE